MMPLSITTAAMVLILFGIGAMVLVRVVILLKMILLMAPLLMWPTLILTIIVFGPTTLFAIKLVPLVVVTIRLVWW